MSTVTSGKLKSSLEDTARKKCVDRTKYALFEVYAKLLRHRDCSRTLSFFLHLILFLQIMDYILEARSYASDDDNIFQSAHTFTGYFRITPVFSRNGTTNGLITIFGTALCFISVLYTTLTATYMFLAGKGPIKFHPFVSWILLLLQYALQFFLVPPTIDVLLTIFTCPGATHELDPSLACWNAVHILIITAFLPLLLFILLGAVLSALFFNEFIPDSKDSLARMDDSYLELRFLLFRVFLSVLSQFWKHSEWDLPLIPLLLSALPLMYFLYIALTRFPYYAPFTYFTYTSGIAINLWVCLFLVLEEMTGRRDTGLVMLLGGLLVLLAIYQYRRKAMHDLIYNERADRLANDPLIALYCHEYLRYVNDKDKDYDKEVALLGLISLHPHECYNPECPLKQDKERTKKTHLHILKGTLNLYSKKANATASIHIYFSCFLISEMDNVFKAATELLLAAKAGPNIQEEFAIYRAQQRVVSEMKKTQTFQKDAISDAIDVRIAIKYEDFVNRLEKQIQEVSNEYVDFWSILEGVMPDFNILHSKGVSIMKFTTEIEELWREITSINNTNKRTNALYGRYARDLKNDKDEGDALLEGTKNYEAKVTGKNTVLAKDSMMFADDTGILIANLAGTILRHNIGVTKLFSYSSQELIGQNVQMLMPAIIGKSHTKLVDLSIESGSGGRLHQMHPTVALHRFGNVFPIVLLVKPIPSLKEGIQFIGFIRKCDKDTCLVLTNEHGKLEGFSSNVGELLGVTPHQLKLHEIYLQLFCPQLAEVDPVADNNDDEEPVTFLDLLTESNADEGAPVEMNLIVTKQHREIISKLPFKEDGLTRKSTHKLLQEYAKRIHEVTGYENAMDKNIITNVMPQNDLEIERTLKGHQWLYDYGNGLVKLRVFKLKLAKRIHKRSFKAKFNKQLEPNRSNRGQIASSKRLNTPKKKPRKYSASMEGSLKAAKYSLFLEPEHPRINPVIPHRTSSELFLDESLSKSGFHSKGGDQGILIQELIKDNLLNKDPNKEKYEKYKDKAPPDETSSTINSSTVSFARQIQMMRNFIKQKVTPRSIQNLKIAAIGVFLTLLVLTSVFFAFSRDIFNTLNRNVNLLGDAESLLNSIVTITAMTRFTTLSEILPSADSFHGNLNEYFKTSINTLADRLQISQKHLEGVGKASKSMVIKYNSPTGFLTEYEMDAELAIISFSVHAHKLVDKPLQDLTPQDTSLSFILLNGFNNIIQNKYDLCGRIVDESQHNKGKNMNTMLILLSVASAALLISLSVLLPVTISVGKNREEIMLLFAEIPLQKIKEEAEKCRQYCTQLHCGEDQSTMLVQNKEIIKEPAKETLAQEQPALTQEEEVSKSADEENNESTPVLPKDTVHTRKYVPFHNPTIKTIIRLFLLMLVLESYFLFGYFQSSTILSNILDLTKEQAGIYSLKFYNSFALRGVQETIANAFAESIIMNQGREFIVGYLDNLVNKHEDFYGQHVSNKDIHNKEYNDLYHGVVYVDMCPYLAGKDVVNCTTELYGLPGKGLHQSNVAFWESLRQVLFDFSQNMDVKKSLNDVRILESEIMLERYIYKAYNILANELKDEVEQIFESESKLMTAIFVIYLVIVAGIFGLWQVFIARMNDGLNSTRTILGIIPPDVIREKKKIRDYMVNTSKLLFSSSK